MESCIVQWDKGFKLKLLKLLHPEMWLLLKLSQCTSLFVHCTVLYSMPYMYHILYTLYVNSILHNLHYRYTLYILHLMLFNMANLGEVGAADAQQLSPSPLLCQGLWDILYSQGLWDILYSQGLSVKCEICIIPKVFHPSVWDILYAMFMVYHPSVRCTLYSRSYKYAFGGCSTSISFMALKLNLQMGILGKRREVNLFHGQVWSDF